MTQFRDLGDMQEDDRIRIIADHVKSGETVGFFVDDWPDKADRYLRKLQKHVPVVVVTRERDLIKGTIFLKVVKANS